MLLALRGLVAVCTDLNGTCSDSEDSGHGGRHAVPAPCVAAIGDTNLSMVGVLVSTTCRSMVRLCLDEDEGCCCSWARLAYCWNDGPAKDGADQDEEGVNLITFLPCFQDGRGHGAGLEGLGSPGYMLCALVCCESTSMCRQGIGMSERTG